MKLTLKIALATVILLIAGLIGTLMHLDYDASIDFIAKYTNTLDRIDRIRYFISVATLHHIIVFLCLLDVALVVLFFTLNKVISAVHLPLSTMFASIAFRARNDWSGTILYLLIIPFAAILFFSIRMPFSLDEAYTYMYFSKRGILSSVSYYPAPNNHVLNSVLSNFSIMLPLPDLFCIRIPTLMVSVLTVLFFYSFIKEYLGKYIALATIAFFSCIFYTTYYAFLCRGYMLQCLFFVLLTYSIFKILAQPQNKLYWLYFSVSAILGFYTLPSFLYPFFFACVFLVVMLRGIGRYLLTSCIAIVIVTCLLYMPIIVTSGLGALIHNEHVASQPRNQIMAWLPGFWFNLAGEVTGFPAIFAWVLITGGMLLMYRERDNRIKYFYLMILVLAPILVVLQSVKPPPRTFEYLTCIVALCMGVVYSEILRKYTATGYYVILLVALQILLIWNTRSRIMMAEKYSLESYKIMTQIDQAHKYFIYSYDFSLPLQQDMLRQKRTDYSIECNWLAASRVDMDTIEKGRADYYIIDHYADQTRNRKPFIATLCFNIYKD